MGLRWLAWPAALAATALAAAALIAGCGGSDGGTSQVAKKDTTCDGKVGGSSTLTAWFHSGEGAERDTLKKQVAAFNASQQDVKVKLVLLPEGDYNEQVQSAAASGDLPAILDFDGPNLYNYAWSGKLKPLDSCVDAELKSQLLSTIVEQGQYAGKTWGVGTFDSGLGLYVRPSILKKIGARIPSGPDDAWTAEEFTEILGKLRDAGYKRPLDLKVNYASGRSKEWFTYGLSPVVWSAGGDLIDRDGYKSAEEALNSDASVEALTIVQSWFEDNLVHPNTADDAFVKGEAAISWVGHWVYGQYSEAFKDDLRIVPLPRFGKQTRTGMGSWQWGITTTAKDGDAAWTFIEYLLQPEQVKAMTDANGAVPATKSVIESSKSFVEGGPLHIYVEQLESGVAKPRPQTPAYPAITAAFGQAIQNISDGGDVREALDTATEKIDRDIKDNEGYPAPER